VARCTSMSRFSTRDFFYPNRMFSALRVGASTGYSRNFPYVHPPATQAPETAALSCLVASVCFCLAHTLLISPPLFFPSSFLMSPTLPWSPSISRLRFRPGSAVGALKKTGTPDVEPSPPTSLMRGFDFYSELSSFPEEPLPDAPGPPPFSRDPFFVFVYFSAPSSATRPSPFLVHFGFCVLRTSPPFLLLLSTHFRSVTGHPSHPC